MFRLLLFTILAFLEVFLCDHHHRIVHNDDDLKPDDEHPLNYRMEFDSQGNVISYVDGAVVGRKAEMPVMMYSDYDGSNVWQVIAAIGGVVLVIALAISVGLWFSRATTEKDSTNAEKQMNSSTLTNTSTVTSTSTK